MEGLTQVDVKKGKKSQGHGPTFTAKSHFYFKEIFSDWPAYKMSVGKMVLNANIWFYVEQKKKTFLLLLNVVSTYVFTITFQKT